MDWFIASARETLESYFQIEEEYLKESFFQRFLTWFGPVPNMPRIPNKELYDYTVTLLEKDRKRFETTNKNLNEWRVVFNPNSG